MASTKYNVSHFKDTCIQRINGSSIGARIAKNYVLMEARLMHLYIWMWGLIKVYAVCHAEHTLGILYDSGPLSFCVNRYEALKEVSSRGWRQHKPCQIGFKDIYIASLYTFYTRIIKKPSKLR